MKILMARHGQSQWQVEGDSAGGDSPLSPTGESQAHHLGRYLAANEALNIAAIYTSDLQRAHRTAEIVAGHLELPLNIELDLREFESFDTGWAPSPTSIWDASPEAALASPYLAYREQILRVLQRIVAAHPDDATVLLIAHGGTIGVILRLIIGSDTPRIWARNAALHAIEWHRPDWGPHWILHYLNCMEYLPQDLRTG